MTKIGKNRLNARKYFSIEDNPNLVLHHKDVNLKYNDINRYNCESNKKLLLGCEMPEGYKYGRCR